MRAAARSHFASAVVGGAMVVGALALLGVTGERAGQTIIEQGTVATGRTSSTTGLTPHEIYVRDAPGVVFVRAQVLEPVQNPFESAPEQPGTASTGSGFVIDGHGHILTNYHVIQGADLRRGVTVEFESDIIRRAVVVGEDPTNDLAVLKVSMSGVTGVQPLALGDSASVRVGDATLAIANPFGLDRTLTSGIVSALQRQIQAANGFAVDNVIQTDAPVDPGNAGGPLLDAIGRVIGINSQIATGGAGGAGIAFAVPVNTAKARLPWLESGGRLKRGYLGISGVAAGRSHGVVVQSADAAGPAASAGLKRGDVIQTIAGHPAASMGNVQAIVGARPGQAVKVRVQRAGRNRWFDIVLGSSPAR